MGDLVYEPPRDGPTLWEVGIPDRSAAEFYVPDPEPQHCNKLFVNHPDRLALFLVLLTNCLRTLINLNYPIFRLPSHVNVFPIIMPT